MRVGILTGGGDCPGLNAVIRAVVRKGINKHHWEIIGIREGWKGLLGETKTQLLGINDVSGILHRGGTILKTSRTNPLRDGGTAEQLAKNMRKLNIECLVAVGGEDTLGVAQRLAEQGIRLVGVPKTIDNDLSGTDQTFGFDTAVNIAMEAIDRLHTTAESHNRVLVCEVMGRHTGWIALYAGLAGGGDVILIPERPVNIEKICDLIRRRHGRGKDFSIVVVSEGAQISFDDGVNSDGTLIVQDTTLDQFGHMHLGGIATLLAPEIERRTEFETRAVILGHIQRGGEPTAYDRVLATRYGSAAVDLIAEGRFGQMVALRGNEIVGVELTSAVYCLKKVDDRMIEMAEEYIG
ncbi:MAG: ATP-dependent 6-phosphofructokinase [Candidatus Zixiibacteriota bacterium]|nr:MAG: ATP-dependent 6-phosphofructokinase [candidate division Zixibacteria bacterium]